MTAADRPPAGVERDVDPRTARLLALALAAVAAAVVLGVSLWLFPYRSLNHDEAVYLQQAAMLLDGQLTLRPPVEDAFRPWFFVEDGDRLYPKYAPPTAALFAAARLLTGWYVAALPAVAAGVVGLTCAVVAEAFDRRTGLLAGAFVLASPLFWLNAATFLPYAPATLLNLGFALCYLRARRLERAGYAAAAGALVGVAFFARPYTAVLFAAPFVVHALYSLAASGFAPGVVGRQAVTAALGLAGVVVALAYNAALTGNPLLFPYQAFAPLDGVGFGRRRLLGYTRYYDLPLALVSNAQALRLLFTQWVAGATLGTLLAAVGLVRWLGDAGWPRVDPDAAEPYRPAHAPALLAGVGVAVILGNVAFWGTLNILGDVADPDGLATFLGPYYHFDLLVPAGAFAAHGALGAWSYLRRRLAAPLTPGERAAVLGAVSLVVAAAFAGATLAAADDAVGRNRAVTETYEGAYAPFLDADGPPDDAVVFVPSPYGSWLNHPFQLLRNDPGFDGPTVYALARERPFEVVDAYPDRALYRFGYRGEWAPYRGTRVRGHLQRVRAVNGSRVVLDVTLGVPAGYAASLRLGAGDDGAYYALNATDGPVDLRVVLTPSGARLVGESVTRVSGNRTVDLRGAEALTLTAFLDRGTGAGFTYRVRTPVRVAGGEVRALTPALELCYVATRCGGEATYVPGMEGPGYLRAAFRNRSSAQTRTMEPAMAAPPESGSSVVSPRRSR